MSGELANTSDENGQPPKRVLLLGATGTIGRAMARALVRDGYAVTCFVRARKGKGRAESTGGVLPGGVTIRTGDVMDHASLRDEGFGDDRFDVVISCLASRDGRPKDAWAIDHQATVNAINIAKEAGVKQFILLSAICVQKPKLAFQHAKLAAEKALAESGLVYSIVRPTAYFKSLSGQIERVRKGKSFMVFGDGMLTACKPISDDDLARYMVGCIEDPSRHNRILPIGGPGPAINPREQGKRLFELTGKSPKFTKIPVGLLTVIIGFLGMLGYVSKRFAEGAEFARIAKYYATESMLVFNTETGAYDAEATPSTGQDTLFEYYADVIEGRETVERGEHSVF